MICSAPRPTPFFGVSSSPTNIKRETIPTDGFGTMLYYVEQNHLLEGHVLVVMGRGLAWAEAKPSAFYQVVELQPVRIRRIMGDASTPDDIRLTASHGV